MRREDDQRLAPVMTGPDPVIRAGRRSPAVAVGTARGETLRVTRLLACTIAIALAAGAPPARAQMDSREAIGLQNQILDLRHQIDGLRDQLSRGGGSSLGSRPPPPAAAPLPSGASDLLPQLLNRISALEDQTRDLRGRVEAVENAQSRQSADLAKQISDLAFQVQQMQTGGAPPPAPAGGTSPPPSPLGTVPAGPAAAPHRTPELAMQEGNAALARRDYPAAEAAAREVLKGGRGPRSYDAQFLLAQALSGERNWRDAAVAYGDSYERGTAAGHAQDALLGLGNSLYSLGDKKSACAALDTLRSQFAQPRADLREGIAAARVRSGCR